MQIEREIKILISNPFVFPESFAPIGRKERVEALERLSRALNQENGAQWKCQSLHDLVPPAMFKRKGVILQTDEYKSHEMEQILSSLNDKRSDKSERHIVSVSRSAYIWDYSMGAIDIHINIRLVSPTGLLGLMQLLTDFFAEAEEQDLILIPGTESFQQAQTQMRNALRRTQLPGIKWLRDAEATNFRQETYAWGLLIQESNSESNNNNMQISRGELSKALTDFCGIQTTDKTFETAVEELKVTHTGYNGHACVVVDKTSAIRAEWLWRLVTLFWGTISEVQEPIYDVIVQLLNNPAQATTRKSAIRTLRTCIDLLNNEAPPTSVCNESFDTAIYEAIWESWSGDKVVERVDKRCDFLETTLDDLQAQESQSIQNRLNFVVFILTVVSITATIAAIIDVLDVQDGEVTVSAIVRASLLGGCTLVIGAVCAFVIVSGSCKGRAPTKLGRWTAGRSSVNPERLLQDGKGDDLIVSVKSTD